MLQNGVLLPSNRFKLSSVVPSLSVMSIVPIVVNRHKTTILQNVEYLVRTALNYCTLRSIVPIGHDQQKMLILLK